MSLSNKLKKIGATCLVVGTVGFLGTAVYEHHQENKIHNQYSIKVPASSESIYASVEEIKNLEGKGLRPYSIPLSVNLPPEYFKLVSLQESNRTAMLREYVDSATQTPEYAEYFTKQEEAKRKVNEKTKGVFPCLLGFGGLIPLGGIGLLTGGILKSKKRDEQEAGR